MAAGLVMPVSGARLPRRMASPPPWLQGSAADRMMARSPSRTPSRFWATVFPVTVRASPCTMGKISLSTACTPPARWKSGTLGAAAGFIRAMCGVVRQRASNWSMSRSHSAS